MFTTMLKTVFNMGAISRLNTLKKLEVMPSDPGELYSFSLSIAFFHFV